ncbi:MAG: GAF domain-containing protein [Elusimicrobiales bacterium]|nr:GAF domain-containing protein [Elusimicrobiales bacterium]
MNDSYEELESERRTGPNKNKRTKFDRLVAGLTAIQNAGAGSASETAAREDFYQTIVDCACDLIDARCGSLMLMDYDNDILSIAAAKNITSHALLNTKIKPGDGIAGRAYLNGEVIFVADPGRNVNYIGYKGSKDENTPFVAIPLKVKNNPFGVLNLHLAEPDSSFSEYELKFLEIFSNAASSMLENINLYEKVDSYYHETVNTLVRVITANDHIKGRIAEISGKKAKRLAQELNLDEATQKNIEYAALLCNIGRLGVDSEILHKKGKLTSAEYEDLKQHIYMSYQILAPIRYFVPVAQMVLYHQEWYNGNGYPDRLSGDRIPLGARIISIINAWEAMITEQPYRPALSFEQAKTELEKGSGTQFDPNIVPVFLKLEKAGWPIRF